MSAPAHSPKRLTLSLILALTAVIGLISFLGRARAQGSPPVVTGVGPALNSASVEPTTLISVAFSHPMSTTTITSQTFRVHGSMSGFLSGSLTYDDATRTAIFDPAHDLKPGELIMASVTTGTQDATGTALAMPHNWSFVVQVSYGGAYFVRTRLPRYDVGSRPYAIDGADFDGDGDIDLITANGSDDTLSLLLNNGYGSFSPAVPRDYGVGNHPADVQGADLDGDGDMDLVTVNMIGNTISVLLNDGQGALTPAVPRDYAVGHAPRSGCLADLDGDGDLDIATGNHRSVSVLSNNGNGSFTAFIPRDYNMDVYLNDIYCADLDNDADVDLAMIDYLHDFVSLLLNEGDGTFSPASPRDYPVGDGPFSIWGGDLDGDHDVDLLTANHDDDVSVLLNDGIGHFTSTAYGNLAVHNAPCYIRTADLDGDGDLDLVTANDTSTADVSVLLNNGDGAFEPAIPRDFSTGGHSYSVYISDLDGDADLDLAIANLFVNQVSILLNFGLEIEKSALSPSSWPGTPITYTLTFTNYGVETMQGIIITDQLPISLTNPSYTYTGPVITPTTGFTYAWQLAPLSPGVTGVITISAIVSPALRVDTAFDNHAFIAGRTGQFTDTATLFVDASPKLWIDKRVQPLPYVAPGDLITYTILVTVSGEFTSSGWLTDQLPGATHFVAATDDFFPAFPVPGTPITWTLPAGTYYPPSTSRYTVVLTAGGSSRPLPNTARAAYPAIVTATDQAGTWLWSDILTDTCQRDIALIFDRSGSMQEETRCYGCWRAAGDYPAGIFYPLPLLYADPPTNTLPLHCQPSVPLSYTGHYYLSIEAEHYSRYELQADYHWDVTEYPKMWWAMQRDPNENSSGPDSRGAFMLVGPNSYHVHSYETISEIVNPDGSGSDYWTTPRLEYDFSVPQSGNYYVWFRAQGGSNYYRESCRQVYVGLNGVPDQTVHTCYWGPYNDGASSSVRKNAHPPSGNCNTYTQGWSWSRAPSAYYLNADQAYELDVWAGGQGFRLDKIVISNDSNTLLDRNGNPLDWTHNGVSDGGPAETHGRTDWACMLDTDPRFSPFDPVTGERDDLYDDYQPLRTAKEASKGFVRQLNPVLDQIGYVWYGDSSSIRNELYCQVYPGFCEGFESVADQIEATIAGGSTNVADGLWNGLWALSTGAEPEPEPVGQGFPPKQPGRLHYGRSQTYGMLILFTDGQANKYPTLPSGYGNCYSDDLWPNVPGESTYQRRARECVAWFGLQAREQGVAIHTIGLGTQVDHELLAHIAELTGGTYYYAPASTDLEAILDAIEAQTQADCLFSGIDVTKSITPEPIVTVGERLTYTVQTTLTGWVRPTLWLTDDLPTHTIFFTATTGFAPTPPTPGGTLAWSLPYGVFTTPLTLTHTIVLTALEGTEVLTNTVVAGDTGDLATTATVTVNVGSIPSYGLSKQVAPSSVVTVGQRVTYTLAVTTNRPDLSVTLTDLLPLDTAFVSASGHYTPVAPRPGDVLAWPLTVADFIEGSAWRTLVLSVTGVPTDGVLVNVAGVAGDTGDLAATATVTVNVNSIPSYGLSKQVAPSSVVTVGQRVTYTLAVTTNRPDLSVTLTDLLPLDTAFVSASGHYTPVAPRPGDVLAWPLTVADFIEGSAWRTLVLSVTGVPTDGVLVNVAGVAGVVDTAVLIVVEHKIFLPLVIKDGS